MARRAVARAAFSRQKAQEITVFCAQRSGKPAGSPKFFYTVALLLLLEMARRLLRLLLPVAAAAQSLLLLGCGARTASGSTQEELVANLRRDGHFHDDHAGAALCRVDRTFFVPRHLPPYVHKATISAPATHAEALQRLEAQLQPGMRALDVGVGSGYFAALVLALVGPRGSIVGVDHIPELVALSRSNIARLNGLNASSRTEGTAAVAADLRMGDGYQGPSDQAPFDAIHVGAAAMHVPAMLTTQLKPGGRMIIPVGQPAGPQELIQVDKSSEGELTQQVLMGVRYVPLVESVEPPAAAPGSELPRRQLEVLPPRRHKTDDGSAAVGAMTEPWLLMDLMDVDETTWGLVVPTANTVLPVNSTNTNGPRPPPAQYSTGSQVLAVFPSWPIAPAVSPWYDVYVSNATGWEPLSSTSEAAVARGGDPPLPPVEDHTVELLRFRTQDFATYSKAESVLKLTDLKTEEGNTVLKSIARNERTGLMVMMVDLPGHFVQQQQQQQQAGDDAGSTRSGNSDGHLRAHTELKAGLGGSYGTMISKTAGSSWELTSCTTGCIHKPDKDDLNVLFDTSADEFVDLQIMWRQNMTLKYCDGLLQGQCQLRAVSAKTSTDGVNWSPDIGPLLTDQLDPPELQFYRARGFYLGGGSTRFAAHALQFANAPGPDVLGYGYGRQPPRCKKSAEPSLRGKVFCHAPHLHEEWWLGPQSGFAANITQWRRPFRSTRAAPHDAFLMANPVVHKDSHLWLGSTGVAYSLPLFRIAGLWSESNAEVAVGPLALPTQALTLNADISWRGKLVTGGCDEGCNAYVFVELQDPETREALPGYGRADAIPLMDVDGLRLPLEWGRNLTAGERRRTTAALAGRPVAIRLFFRSAILYALMAD